MSASRREFLEYGLTGTLLLTFSIGGCERKATPAQARSAQAEFRALQPGEVQMLDALGEILVPGAAAAGLSHYLDQQLAGDAAHSMLMIKYLRVPAPFIDFYRAGLKAIDSAAHKLHGRAFAELNAEEGAALVGKVAAGTLSPWEGPPAPFLYFVLRSDAVDVSYGTPEGFARLNVPYMAHIAPPRGWG